MKILKVMKKGDEITDNEKEENDKATVVDEGCNPILSYEINENTKVKLYYTQYGFFVSSEHNGKFQEFRIPLHKVLEFQGKVQDTHEILARLGHYRGYEVRENEE